MQTITRQELQEILVKQAKKDLAFARRLNNSLIVSDTILGNIEINYNPETRQYSIRQFNTDKLLLAPAKSADTVAFLANNYDLVLQDTVVV